MVIDSIFVYHFVDPDLRVKTFFEKDGGAEKEQPSAFILKKGI